MENYQFDDKLKKRVEKFYAYKWSTERELASMDLNELKQYLPNSLVQNIMIVHYKELLQLVWFF